MANENISELVFILDRSGSMRGLESDTVGGFNSLIDKQKTIDGKCFVTTVLFNHLCETLHDRVDLADVKPMTEDDFGVRGCTALLDALGGAIRHVEQIHRYARPEDVPGRTCFVIMTDGLENASRRFDSGTVKRMIEQKKEEAGWEFLFLAANIDAVETAVRYGIDVDRAVEYLSDGEGTRLVYETVADTLCASRLGAIPNNWSKNIEADRKRRKKNGK